MNQSSSALEKVVFNMANLFYKSNTQNIVFCLKQFANSIFSIETMYIPLLSDQSGKLNNN